MKKIVIDANIPISFIHKKVNLWETFGKYVEETSHEIIMPIEVYDEVIDRKTRQVFEANCCFIKQVETNQKLFYEIKTECESLLKRRNLIQDNDFKLITAAIDQKADILVSNDYELLNVLEKYKQHKGIPKNQLLFLRAAGLLRLMHNECKNIFDWGPHVVANLKFYHHIEIPNTCDGMLKRNWNEKFAKSRFIPFQNNIIETVIEVGRQ